MKGVLSYSKIASGEFFFHSDCGKVVSTFNREGKLTKCLTGSLSQSQQKIIGDKIKSIRIPYGYKEEIEC